MEPPGMSKALFLFIQVLLLYSTTEGKNTVNMAEQKLMNKLFPSSSPSLRDVLPVKSDSSPVNVTIQIALRQIMDVLEKEQIICLSVWIRQYWNNPMLTWDISKYDNISSINVEKNLVWVPDICLYNTADDSDSLYQQLDTKLIVKNNGDCAWLAPIILKSECKMNVRYFPFDEQSCIIKFGSWTYNSKRIDIAKKSPIADTSVYIENGEWDLIEVPAQRHIEYYPCCPEPYPTITYTVRIRRRILYYVSNLIVPCGVIAALAFLSFYLPADSGERISLVITVLLAMTVYMLMVSSAMPPTSEVIPLIGKFYLAVMIEIALCLVATCVTIRWYHTDTPMSPKLKRIVMFLWKLLLCNKKDNKHKSIQVACDQNSYYINNKQQQQQALVSTMNYDEVTQPTSTNQLQLKAITRNPMSELEQIHQDVTVLSKKVENEVNDEKIQADWKKAVEVLDFLFFIMFTMTFLMFSAILFSAIPHYKD